MLNYRDGTKFYGFDIETLGKTPDCVVVSAAFLVFDFNEDKTFQQYVDEACYVKFNVSAQKKAGRVVDQDTLNWWKRQDDVVRRELMPSENDVSIEEGTAEILQYLKSKGIHDRNGKDVIRFCRGQDFDIPIMGHLMKSVGQELPGAYWNSRDIRTFISGVLCDMTTTVLYKDDRVYKTIPGFRAHDARHDIAKAIVEMKNCVKLTMGQMELDDL